MIRKTGKIKLWIMKRITYYPHPYSENNIYIFLARQVNAEWYFCHSFFPKEQKDYTKGQAIYTMLYKEKICLSTGKVQIQYDRFTPKNIKR